MIDPKTEDVGRQVIYRDHTGEPEEGVITSFNDSAVFVRYAGKIHAQATSREDLEWTHHG